MIRTATPADAALVAALAERTTANRWVRTACSCTPYPMPSRRASRPKYR
jgi:hypothetical protein